MTGLVRDYLNLRAGMPWILTAETDRGFARKFGE